MDPTTLAIVVSVSSFFGLVVLAFSIYTNREFLRRLSNRLRPPRQSHGHDAVEVAEVRRRSRR